MSAREGFVESTIFRGGIQMKRSIFVVVIALLALAPLFAQSPKGWKLRVDRSSNASDPDAAGAIKFVTMGSGFHATNPQAAVYWNPANTIAGNYTLKGTFTAGNSSPHSEYYGLIFAGSGLEGAEQNYLYFLVAPDGSYLIKHRDGAMAQTVLPATPSDAVKTGDKASNTLEVRVMADKIDFVINGTVVKTMPKTGQTAKTDGIYGIRVNHMLEVQVDGFAASKH
jgi:hypothetical protein